MSQASAPQMNSIVAADFGNVRTRALIIELVEGAYTLVSSVNEPSTHAFPANDPGVALLRALRQLGEASGRRLISGDRIITPEQPNRIGADAFVATSSVGQPLRTVVLGLMPGFSFASALRATAGTYVSIVETLTLEEALHTGEAINTIRLARPDLLLITGGVDGGAVKPVRYLAETAALAIRLMAAAERPMVLYAGNASLAGEIQQRFFELTTVFTAPNVRPNARRETLAPAQLQLAAAFDSITEKRAHGFVSVGAQSRVGVLPNAQSYQLIAGFLGQSVKSRPNVLILDVGSATSTLAASVRGRAGATIRTDIGVGHSAPGLLNEAGLEAVRAWLPFAASDTELRDYALNKAARPGQIPDSLRALYLEHALLRAAMRLMLNVSRPTWNPERLLGSRKPLPPFGRLIGAGGALTGVGRPGLAAMLMLDALQPTGVTRLEVDADALIPALGAIARFNPQAVVQLLDRRGLDLLGTCFSLSGHPKPDKPAAKVRITLSNGEVVRAVVPGGQIWCYPLGLGVRARVEVKALGGSKIGSKTGIRAEVVGGAAGVIVDARGRPLPLATEIKALAAQLAAWYAQATGDPIREIQTEWLDEAVIESPPSPPAAEPPARDKKDRRKGKSGADAAAVPAPLSDDLLPALEDLTAESIPAALPPPRAASAPAEEPVDDLRNLLS